MCSNCNKILKKFKGAIISSASKYFKEIKVNMKFEDFMSHIRVKYFVAKENNTALADVSPGYFFSIARNLKTDFNSKKDREVNLNFNLNSISSEDFNIDLNRIEIEHSQYVTEQYEKDQKNLALIKILRECKEYLSDDEFSALLSVYEEENLKDYQIRNNFSKTNSALIARKIY